MQIETRIGGPNHLRIAHVIASIESEAAGTTLVIRRLTHALAQRGLSVDLLAVGRDEGCTSQEGVKIRQFPRDFASIPLLRKLYLSRELNSHIRVGAAQGSLIHSHGLWLMPNVYPGIQARRYGAPHIVSPHGMLAPAALRFSSRKKMLFSLLVQKRALASVSCFHATCEEELHEIRALGLHAPVAVIPNGIDLPVLDLGTKQREFAERTVLYLGRLHPKKGLTGLLEAWSRIEAAHPGWRLDIVGPSEGGHGEELATMSARLGLSRVSFKGPIFGDEKLAVLRNADILVMPSLNENFGMVVAESLAVGTPVISTKGAPWQGLTENGCGWWIDHGVDVLSQALSRAMSFPRVSLALMGERGRAWMERDFSWSHIAEEMSAVYLWCRGQGPRPPYVFVDR